MSKLMRPEYKFLVLTMVLIFFVLVAEIFYIGYAVPLGGMLRTQDNSKDGFE